MGEQMLSREYYYLGTQLPMDRFLTFYYGHPGFHINNILVILSVQLFMFALVFLGTMNNTLTICRYTADGQFVGGQGGCYNLVPVYDWIKRSIISIFIVFFIGKSYSLLRELYLNLIVLRLLSFPTAILTRINGARSFSGHHSIRETFLIPVANLRSFQHSNFFALNPQQFDLRRC